MLWFLAFAYACGAALMFAVTFLAILISQRGGYWRAFVRGLLWLPYFVAVACGVKFHRI